MTNRNPLIGTTLHRCLVTLEQAQTLLGEDVKTDFDAAGRLVDADAGMADAIASVRKELNRRYAALREKGAQAPTPPAKVATVALAMPGPAGTPSVYFEKTRRGIGELLDFVEEALPDGGGGIVLKNHELFDRLAEISTKTGEVVFAERVAALRAAVSEGLEAAE